jgi:superoxide dismutase, Cu-Zn family
MFQKLAIILFSVAFLTGAASAQERSAEVLGNKGEKIGSINVKQGPHGVVLRVMLDARRAYARLAWRAYPRGRRLFGSREIHAFQGSRESGRRRARLPQSQGAASVGSAEHFAFSDGSSQAEMLVPGVSLSGGKINLLDGDGTAVVFHAEPDDHMTQPIGGAGARVGCAALK